MNYHTEPMALRDRIRSAAKNQGLDAEKMASRYVAERWVDHFKDAFGPSPIALCGGLRYPQHLRPTSDADIKCVRRFTEQELTAGMELMKLYLRSEGIEISKYTFRDVDIGLADPVRRIRIEATAGGVRANTQIDMKSESGPNAFSKDWAEIEHPPLFPGGPTYTARVESDEAALAEKWLAVLTQPKTDLRAKHLMDVIFLSCQPDIQIDHKKVADEMVRLQAHRGIRWDDITTRPGDALSWTSMKLRSEDWTRLSIERKCFFDLHDGFIQLGREFGKIKDHWKRHMLIYFREREPARRMSSGRIGRVVAPGFQEQLSPEPRQENVVQLSHFRR